MAFEILITNSFKKDLKLIKKRSDSDYVLVSKFLLLLQAKGRLWIPAQNKPHKLIGNYKDSWEAHIKPDLLIIWFQVDSKNEITLTRCGTHADLFK